MPLKSNYLPVMMMMICYSIVMFENKKMNNWVACISTVYTHEHINNNFCFPDREKPRNMSHNQIFLVNKLRPEKFGIYNKEMFHMLQLEFNKINWFPGIK